MKISKHFHPQIILKLALIFTISLTMSCSKDSDEFSHHVNSVIEDVSTSAQTSHRQQARSGKQVPRPIKNSYVGEDRPDGSGQDFYGTMSHVGLFTGHTVTTAFYPNSDGTFTLTSEDEIVAANGDVIYTRSRVLVVFGNPMGTQGTYSGGFDIVGGTGRFDGATGRMNIDNGVFKDGVSRHNAVGEITY
jgi:hypothetical protein